MEKLPLQPQPVDGLKVFARRRGLSSTRRALVEGRLTLGFIGGSITDGWENRWPSPVAGWFAEAFPNVMITAENAAIGATGSDSACLRVDEEIIGRGCHLTFVEYAVNDSEQTDEARGRSREGLLRKLLAAGGDVVLVYTFRQEFYADMIAGRVPASIAAFERLAEHYEISSVWMGLHALQEVRAGRMRWDEWLPDGLHPGHRGSWSYAQPVIAFLRQELAGAGETGAGGPLPAPLYDKNWQSMTLLPLTEVRLEGPWIRKRIYGGNHVTQVLETHAPGARLAFDFTGRGLVLVLDYGKISSEFQYRLDGGAWMPVVRERPDWAGPRGMVRALLISDELVPGPHRFEMEVTHGDRKECGGTECRLALIGVL